MLALRNIMLPDLVKTSKFLTLILRHKPEEIWPSRPSNRPTCSITAPQRGS
jgi:hypothetical protein